MFFPSKHHVSEPFAPQVLLIQIQKTPNRSSKFPAEPGGVGTPGNRGHLNQAENGRKKPCVSPCSGWWFQPTIGCNILLMMMVNTNGYDDG